jgi:hypothetical protein
LSQVATGSAFQASSAKEDAMRCSRPNHELTLLYEELVLLLGDVFALHSTDDETIRDVASGLERS